MDKLPHQPERLSDPSFKNHQIKELLPVNWRPA
jgi:hypothetical protein